MQASRSRRICLLRAARLPALPLVSRDASRYPVAIGIFPSQWAIAEATDMGIDSESEIAANLQIGPTTLGMVRIYIEAEGVDLPLDFDPDEALEIAEELRAAAESLKKGGRR